MYMSSVYFCEWTITEYFVRTNDLSQSYQMQWEEETDLIELSTVSSLWRLPSSCPSSRELLKVQAASISSFSMSRHTGSSATSSSTDRESHQNSKTFLFKCSSLFWSRFSISRCISGWATQFSMTYSHGGTGCTVGGWEHRRRSSTLNTRVVEHWRHHSSYIPGEAIVGTFSDGLTIGASIWKTLYWVRKERNIHLYHDCIKFELLSWAMAIDTVF